MLVDGYGVPNGMNGNGSVVVNGNSAAGPEAASQQSNGLLIVDARSYAAAVANRAKGGGCECQGLLLCHNNCRCLRYSQSYVHLRSVVLLVLLDACKYPLGTCAAP